MSDLPEWFEEAEKDLIIKDHPVVIDRFGHLFHNPEKFEYTLDMTEENIFKAVEHSNPCSKCYPILHARRKAKEQLEFQNL